MRVLLLLVLIGCGDDAPVIPDAGADAPPDAAQGDFFGEPCTPGSTLGVVQTCRDELAYPKAYCTPDGTCRPFCGAVSVSGEGLRECKDVGGVETWAFATSAARVCYCEP